MKTRAAVVLTSLGIAVAGSALFVGGNIAPVYALSCKSGPCTYYFSDGGNEGGLCKASADGSQCNCVFAGNGQQQSACSGPAPNQP